jgi:hypothetical protein
MNSKSNIVDFFEQFENKHKAFINIIIRPLFMLLIFLSIAYYTTWMSANYVHQESFLKYLEKQSLNDTKQDEFNRTRYEVTQTKLDAIINQQVAYTEQLKTYNSLLQNYQKQLDNINDRLLYLERTTGKKSNSFNGE